VSVTGGIRGGSKSQDAVRNEDAEGAIGSPSFPRSVGKAIKKRVGQPLGREAGAPATSRRGSSKNRLRCVRAGVVCAVFAATALWGGIKPSVMEVRMRMIGVSVAASVDGLRPRASLRVALHVTNRQSATMRAIA
jgi:hypothetical protein